MTMWYMLGSYTIFCPPSPCYNIKGVEGGNICLLCLCAFVVPYPLLEKFAPPLPPLFFGVISSICLFSEMWLSIRARVCIVILMGYVYRPAKRPRYPCVAPILHQNMLPWLWLKFDWNCCYTLCANSYTLVWYELLCIQPWWLVKLSGKGSTFVWLRLFKVLLSCSTTYGDTPRFDLGGTLTWTNQDISQCSLICSVNLMRIHKGSNWEGLQLEQISM